jgi:hypothetical protein
MDKKYLALPDLCTMTGESRSVWKKRIRNREVGSVKLGKNRRVPLECVEKYIRDRVVEAKI